MQTDAGLRAAVARAVGSTDCQLGRARREQLDYDAFLAHRTVHRIRGDAVADGRAVSWSLIEKVTEGPRAASRYLRDNAERELAFYTATLPGQLGSRVRAARLWGSDVGSDGRITLWLEDVPHDGPRPLDADAILGAARDLGELAGHWLGRPPRCAWLFTDWIERHAQSDKAAAGLATLQRARPAALPRWGHRLDEAQRLVEAQPEVRRLLETLPQTLCHHDAVGANVLRADGRTVLIDWESVGPGPVGADLASLLFASARRGDASASVVAAVSDAATDAYADGVQAAAGSVDRTLVRTGVDASIALRWKLAADVAQSVEGGGAPRRGSAPDEPPERALDELSLLVDVLLDAAARALSR